MVLYINQVPLQTPNSLVTKRLYVHLFRLPTRLHCTSMLLARVLCCSLREKKGDYLSHIVTGKCSRAEEHSVCLRLMFSINGNGIVDGPITANYPLVHFSLSLSLSLFQAPSLTRLHITATYSSTLWRELMRGGLFIPNQGQKWVLYISVHAFPNFVYTRKYRNLVVNCSFLLKPTAFSYVS